MSANDTEIPAGVPGLAVLYALIAASSSVNNSPFVPAFVVSSALSPIVNSKLPEPSIANAESSAVASGAPP